MTTDKDQRIFSLSLSRSPQYNSVLTSVLCFKVKQQSSATDNEERSMKDLAAENSKMKLTMSSETFKQSQEMYDKGKKGNPDMSGLSTLHFG